MELIVAAITFWGQSRAAGRESPELKCRRLQGTDECGRLEGVCELGDTVREREACTEDYFRCQWIYNVSAVWENSHEIFSHLKIQWLFAVVWVFRMYSTVECLLWFSWYVYIVIKDKTTGWGNMMIKRNQTNKTQRENTLRKVAGPKQKAANISPLQSVHDPSHNRNIIIGDGLYSFNMPVSLFICSKFDAGDPNLLLSLCLWSICLVLIWHLKKGGKKVLI